MLLNNESRSINVERQSLGVESDEDGARNIVCYPLCDLLTERVHMIVSDVVMSVIQSSYHQTTLTNLSFYLRERHLCHGSQSSVDVEHGDAVNIVDDTVNQSEVSTNNLVSSNQILELSRIFVSTNQSSVLPALAVSNLGQ